MTELTVVGHFPIMDLEGGQEDLILAAARHVAAQARAGVTSGVDCQAGISRTSTVAIAYLLVRGHPLDAATRQVRAARPEAMPALKLWHSLEVIAAQLSPDGEPGQRWPPEAINPPGASAEAAGAAGWSSSRRPRCC